MRNKSSKVGILIGILAVPTFIFVLLKLFGQNYYKLPYLMPEMDETGQIVMKGPDTVFHQIPPYELIDQQGKKFSSANVKGKIYIADFFFTRCGTICPKLSNSLSRVQSIFSADSNVVIVSHSVDPKHDSSAVLQQYAQKYDAKYGKWYFLTGDKKTIYDIAIKGYKLPVSDASEYDNKIKSIDETFIHSEKLLLIDKEGYIRGIYDGTYSPDVERLIGEVKVLSEIYKSKK
ncbi:SCO family protein [Emticicia aquatilis]|uniref:SCO family protein n=1 Tax=Emticicia aquatilis TaxID=1537369 RepID=A0A917DYH3_9BACT|nr:SCO family protein [Emticicia aquatilis]GGD78728.1 SCO family protein [Emticicia aquatilis]